MRDTNDMMEDHAICEDTMMECSSDGGGLEDLVNLASNIADSAPSIREAAERLLTLLGVDDDSDDVSSSEDEGVEVDLEESDSDDPIDARLLNQLAVSLAHELKYAKQQNSAINNTNHSNKSISSPVPPPPLPHHHHHHHHRHHHHNNNHNQNLKNQTIVASFDSEKHKEDKEKEQKSTLELYSSSIQCMELCATDFNQESIENGETFPNRSSSNHHHHSHQHHHHHHHHQIQMMQMRRNQHTKLQSPSDYPPTEYSNVKQESMEHFLSPFNDRLTPTTKTTPTVTTTADSTISLSHQQQQHNQNQNQNPHNSQTKNDSLTTLTKNFQFGSNENDTLFNRYNSTPTTTTFSTGILDESDHLNDEYEYDNDTTEMAPVYETTQSSSDDYSSYSLLDNSYNSERLLPQLTEEPRLTDPVSWGIGWDACATEALRYLLEDEGLSPNHPTVTAMKNHLDLQRARVLSQFPTA